MLSKLLVGLNNSDKSDMRLYAGLGLDRLAIADIPLYMHQQAISQQIIQIIEITVFIRCIVGS
jgi:hypothetical protein